jgi:acyl carrier protein
MRQQEVLAFLKRELDDIVDIDVSAVGPETPLSDLRIDSLASVQLMIAIQRKYGVELSEDILMPDSDKTVADFCHAVAAELV